MSRATVIVDSLAYTIAADDEAARAQAIWPVAYVRVVDEVTGRAPAGAIVANCRTPELTVAIGADGRVGAITQPAPRYPRALAPGLAVRLTVSVVSYTSRDVVLPIVRALTAPAGGATLTLDDRRAIVPGQQWLVGDPLGAHDLATIAALGPGPLQVTLATPLGAAYPAGTAVAPAPLTPLDFGEIALRRTATALRGRVVEFIGGAWLPIGAADVSISFIWRTQADTPFEVAKQPANLVAFSPPLVNACAGGDPFQPVTFTPVAANTTSLLGAVPAGVDRVRVRLAGGLAVGALLRIDGSHADINEFIAVTGVDADGTAAEPAFLQLAQPLRFDHRDLAAVEQVTTPPALAAKSIVRDGLPGDTVVFLNDLVWASTPTGGQVSTPASASFGVPRLFATKSDAAGYFSLPPITRVAKVRVRINAPPRPPQDIDVEPARGSATEWLDVRFP